MRSLLTKANIVMTKTHILMIKPHLPTVSFQNLMFVFAAWTLAI